MKNPLMEKEKIYGASFKKHFGAPLRCYAGKLCMMGIWDFDIMKFDRYMQTKGCNIEKDGSCASYVREHYGKDAENLIKTLI